MWIFIQEEQALLPVFGKASDRRKSSPGLTVNDSQMAVSA